MFFLSITITALLYIYLISSSLKFLLFLACKLQLNYALILLESLFISNPYSTKYLPNLYFYFHRHRP